MSYAIVFPGQGAQEIGMGKDFFEEYEVSKAVFQDADEALGFPLSDFIFGGPDDELVKTAIAQPAILTVSIAVLRAVEEELRRRGVELSPSFYAGHSLGEYTVLVAAGVLSLADAVRLVHKRGELMQDAVPIGKGTMSAILGLDLNTVKEICHEAKAWGVCNPANANAPAQIVISGEVEAVKRAGDLAKEKGASKVIPLKVSAPFHSDLMRPVADRLEREFSSLTWEKPARPIIANVDSSLLESTDDIKRALYEQTYSPVLWADGILAMEKLGVNSFLEFGPGNVLTGLAKRICKGKKAISVSKVGDIDKVLDVLEGAGS